MSDGEASPATMSDGNSRSSRRASSRGRKASESPFEVFPDTLQVRNLPVVVFSDEADEQLVWHDGSVQSGRVLHLGGEPDVRARNPVVMSPAYLGFAIEPYEKRYLHYRGVGIVFARPRGGKFMQPSIDTILVCRALADSLADGRAVRRIIDVGSGSGLIGKFAAVHAPGEGELEVCLVDIDPEAMRYSQSPGFNAPSKGMKGRQIAWDCRAEDAVGLLENDPDFDLLVSNPPYIPTKLEAKTDQLDTSAGGFWEGISLVVFLLQLVFQKRCPSKARLVMMVTSITLKSEAVVAALDEAVAKGCRVRVLLEREIAWKAWYAGPSALKHLIASEEEKVKRRQVGGCQMFVGATEPGDSRTGSDGRDRLWGYHWHVAYVVEIQPPG